SDGTAAEKRDERAALHSITSSARSGNAGGICKPVALAVLRLITRTWLAPAPADRPASRPPRCDRHRSWRPAIGQSDQSRRTSARPRWRKSGTDRSPAGDVGPPG